MLELERATPFTPDPEWAEAFSTLAQQAAVALEHALTVRSLTQANQDLRDAYDETIEGWARAHDLRDAETEGHSRRVTDMSVRLARAMGIPEHELTYVRWGALLHDIGKMGVPDSVLLKPGPLTPDERMLMEVHTRLAEHLLRPIRFLLPALDIPVAHHEKWDGTGYPGGLSGEDIPLSARIFAVVDVFDALVSDRPYRRAWSRAEALAYIEAQAGRHFDPAVTREFLRWARSEHDGEVHGDARRD